MNCKKRPTKKKQQSTDTSVTLQSDPSSSQRPETKCRFVIRETAVQQLISCAVGE